MTDNAKLQAFYDDIMRKLDRRKEQAEETAQDMRDNQAHSAMQAWEATAHAYDLAMICIRVCSKNHIK